MPTQKSLSAVPPKTLTEMRPIILRITKQYGVTNVRIFGSFARNDHGQYSDVDLLMDPPKGMSLFDLSGLKTQLEAALHRDVDVIPARSIKPLLRDTILAEARPL